MVVSSSLSPTKQQVAILSSASLLLVLAQRFAKHYRRHSPMAERFQHHVQEFEKRCGISCPTPHVFFMPWFALRVFLKSVWECKQFDFLCFVHDKLGDTWWVPLPMQSTYVVTVSQENVEHVLKSNFENYAKGEDFFIPRMHDVLGQGIFNVDGDKWYYQRKVASHMFSQKKLTNHMWHTIDRNCKKVVDLLLKKEDAVVDIFNLMNRFTLDTIGEIGFARNIGSLDNATSPFLKSFDRAQQILFLRMILPMWRLRRLLRLGDERDSTYHFRLLQDYSLETVRDLKDNLKSEKGDSFVGLFMQEAEKNGSLYDEALMRDMVLNFLIAGRDTTAHSLSWTFYLLTGHPDVEKKILDEISNVIGNREVAYDDLNKLPFTQAVVNESLRLYPSVPLDAKKALADDTLPDGTFIERGDVFCYNIFAMGRSKTIWGEDAEEFKPERWLGRDFPRLYTYPVFNAGPRECLGKRLAWVEMKACLVQILRRVKLELTVPRDAILYDVQLTIGMSSGLPCRIKAR